MENKYLYICRILFAHLHYWNLLNSCLKDTPRKSPRKSEWSMHQCIKQNISMGYIRLVGSFRRRLLYKDIQVWIKWPELNGSIDSNGTIKFWIIIFTQRLERKSSTFCIIKDVDELLIYNSVDYICTTTSVVRSWKVDEVRFNYRPA